MHHSQPFSELQRVPASCRIIFKLTLNKPWQVCENIRSVNEAGLHWVCSDEELANSQYYPSTVLHTWYLTDISTPFTSSYQYNSNVLNFVANGGELGEQNVFEYWSTFEPSKWPYLEKKRETALGSASCCNLSSPFQELTNENENRTVSA